MGCTCLHYCKENCKGICRSENISLQMCGKNSGQTIKVFGFPQFTYCCTHIHNNYLWIFRSTQIHCNVSKNSQCCALYRRKVKNIFLLRDRVF